jgi:hypothetical protein
VAAGHEFVQVRVAPARKRQICVRYNANQMSPELHRRLYELITNPPPGSKIAEAKEFGVDLVLLLELLGLTPQQRVEEMERVLQFQEIMEAALRKTQRCVIPDYEFS